MTDTLRGKLIQKGWVTPFNADTLVRLIEEHYADEPAVPEGREPAAVISEPSDAELLCIAAEAIDGYGNGINPGDYEPATECAVEAYGSELCAYARAVLARWGNLKVSLTSSPPADGEVAELTGQLIEAANGAAAMGWDQHAKSILRAAELLQRQVLVPVAVPGEQYHEDMGPVTWWRLPVDEPPWVGTPNDWDWPGYHTHFTPAPPVPVNAHPLPRPGVSE